MENTNRAINLAIASSKDTLTHDSPNKIFWLVPYMIG